MVRKESSKGDDGLGREVETLRARFAGGCVPHGVYEDRLAFHFDDRAVRGLATLVVGRLPLVARLLSPVSTTDPQGAVKTALSGIFDGNGVVFHGPLI